MKYRICRSYCDFKQKSKFDDKLDSASMKVFTFGLFLIQAKAQEEGSGDFVPARSSYRPSEIESDAYGRGQMMNDFSSYGNTVEYVYEEYEPVEYEEPVESAPEVSFERNYHQSNQNHNYNQNYNQNYNGNHAQTPQVSNQYPQQSNQTPQQSNQYPQKSNQYPQQSNQYAQQSNQTPQQSNQYPQQSNQYAQQSNQKAQVSNQYLKAELI